jgi:L,D-transpeptidase catalytic domain
MLRTGLIGLVLAAALFAPRTIDASSAARGNAIAATAASSAAAFSIDDFRSTAIGSIEPNVLDLALGAASCAVKSGAVGSPRTLTVIDYSLPSTEKRLWVYDLTTRELLYEELVAHGQGSGANLATRFSNQPDSHQTSLGLFVTDETYVGKNGYSLRLDGLDKGVNDRARARAIVMHGAPYVSPSFVKANGRLGRSHGCPAVSDAVARRLIDHVKGGGLVFAYHRDAGFLKTSKYLGGGCGA